MRNQIMWTKKICHCAVIFETGKEKGIKLNFVLINGLANLCTNTRQRLAPEKFDTFPEISSFPL